MEMQGCPKDQGPEQNMGGMTDPPNHPAHPHSWEQGDPPEGQEDKVRQIRYASESIRS
jgi:hypothetical protein